MKYIKIFMLFIFVFIIGCGNGKGYSEITYKNLLDMIENKDSFLLMISSSTCPHCDQFKITIEELNKKYKTDIKYIDVDKLNQDEMLNLKALFPYRGTPVTIKIVDGQEENIDSRIDGAKDYSYTKQKLIEWKYIKE